MPNIVRSVHPGIWQQVTGSCSFETRGRGLAHKHLKRSHLQYPFKKSNVKEGTDSSVSHYQHLSNYSMFSPSQNLQAFKDDLS